MKDVLLKIMFKHFVQDKEHYEGCTTEIADIVKAFDEWKDKRLMAGQIYLHNGFYFYARKYTYNQLFKLWYNKIRDKN